MSDVRVEQAGPESWPAWRDIRLRSLLADPEAYGSTHEREAAFDEATWRSRLDGTGGPAVLAFAGEEPVGLGAGWRDEPGRLMVVAMWTAPSWRGRGVGWQILDHLVGWARERSLLPHLWVADANPGARRLYERYGFRPDGETMPLREGSPLTATHLGLPAAP
ncbi:GNAT family N-acetyltransferase [Plantactinospora sp. CA-290183]|uniref:GNAT family N-acetyltransferase n=1 Tax=Plantactinospora sp. CA-290183 TaxID=3240006 RepID=UPI003D8F0B19